MNIFHRYENCTDRKCPIHTFMHISDGLAQVSRDIRELNEKYPIRDLEAK